MIITPSDHITIDTRFKSWAKKITDPKELKLELKNGYSLDGSWIKIHETTTLKENEFLVIAAETGSRKNCSYEYVLIQGNGTIHRNTQEKIMSEIYKEFKVAENFNEEITAKAANSLLYKFACFMAKFYDIQGKIEIDFSALETEKAKLLNRIAEIDAIIERKSL